MSIVVYVCCQLVMMKQNEPRFLQQPHSPCMGAHTCRCTFGCDLCPSGGRMLSVVNLIRHVARREDACNVGCWVQRLWVRVTMCVACACGVGCLGALSCRALEPVLTHVGLRCWNRRAYATEQCARAEASEPLYLARVCVCGGVCYRLAVCVCVLG